MPTQKKPQSKPKPRSRQQCTPDGAGTTKPRPASEPRNMRPVTQQRVELVTAHTEFFKGAFDSFNKMVSKQASVWMADSKSKDGGSGPQPQGFTGQRKVPAKPPSRETGKGRQHDEESDGGEDTIDEGDEAEASVIELADQVDEEEQENEGEEKEGGEDDLPHDDEETEGDDEEVENPAVLMRRSSSTSKLDEFEGYTQSQLHGMLEAIMAKLHKEESVKKNQKSGGSSCGKSKNKPPFRPREDTEDLDREGDDLTEQAILKNIRPNFWDLGSTKRQASRQTSRQTSTGDNSMSSGRGKTASHTRARAGQAAAFGKPPNSDEQTDVTRAKRSSAVNKEQVSAVNKERSKEQAALTRVSKDTMSVSSSDFLADLQQFLKKRPAITCSATSTSTTGQCPLAHILLTKWCYKITRADQANIESVLVTLNPPVDLSEIREKTVDGHRFLQVREFLYCVKSKDDLPKNLKPPLPIHTSVTGDSYAVVEELGVVQLDGADFKSSIAFFNGKIWSIGDRDANAGKQLVKEVV